MLTVSKSLCDCVLQHSQGVAMSRKSLQLQQVANEIQPDDFFFLFLKDLLDVCFNFEMMSLKSTLMSAFHFLHFFSLRFILFGSECQKEELCSVTVLAGCGFCPSMARL